MTHAAWPGGPPLRPPAGARTAVLERPADGLRFTTTVRFAHWDDALAAKALRSLSRRGHLPDELVAADFAKLRVRPTWSRLLPPPANRVVTSGLTQLWTVAMGASPDWTVAAAGSAMVVVGVGTGNTGDAIGQTDLQGGSKSYRRCDDGYPTRSAGTWTVRSSFQTGEGNFAPWDEYAIFVPATGASAVTGSAVTAKASLPGGSSAWSMFNRKAPAGIPGKASGILTIQFAIVAV